MATKSNKPASKGKKHVPAPEEKIEGAIGKTEEFLQNNMKPLLIVLIVAVLLVGGYFAYRYLVQEPKMQKAADAMYTAEMLFMQADYSAALNGDGVNDGFLNIVDTYGSTPQGRLAAHYAGVCYMQLGQYDDALIYLQKYNTRKGAPAVVINAQNFGLQGDVYAQQGNYKKASELYDLAVKEGDNVLTTAYYLKKYALANEKLGNIQEALKACNRIKTDYANSFEARDIEKMIGRLEQK